MDHSACIAAACFLMANTEDDEDLYGINCRPPIYLFIYGLHHISLSPNLASILYATSHRICNHGPGTAMAFCGGVKIETHEISF